MALFADQAETEGYKTKAEELLAAAERAAIEKNDANALATVGLGYATLYSASALGLRIANAASR